MYLQIQPPAVHVATSCDFLSLPAGVWNGSIAEKLSRIVFFEDEHCQIQESLQRCSCLTWELEAGLKC